MLSRGLASLAKRWGLSVEVGPARAVWRCQQQLQQPLGQCQCRPYSSGTLDDHQAEVEAINERFVEAREEIEYAQEDAETVYFNESADAARKAVGEVLDAYSQLCAKLSEDERGRLQRSMGLKMEQLRAELDQLDHLHAD